MKLCLATAECSRERHRERKALRADCMAELKLRPRKRRTTTLLG